jgi:hypothetical protein
MKDKQTIEVEETKGLLGNVIAGTINRGDRIYTTTLAGDTRVLNYSVLNYSAATGGEDEEGENEYDV